MNRNLAIKLDGFGGVCFYVGDGPLGGILNDEQLRGSFLPHSLDDFWLQIRNR